jgi:Fe-S cluster assembly protein SufD
VAVNTFSFGGNLTKQPELYHFGERIVSYLNGITIIGEKQHVDHYTLVQHASPIVKVTKITKDILWPLNGSFQRKNFVEEPLKKTNAFQKSNNIYWW